MCIVLNINVIFETYGALIDPAATLEYFYFNCTRSHFDKQKRFSMLWENFNTNLKRELVKYVWTLENYNCIKIDWRRSGKIKLLGDVSNKLIIETFVLCILFTIINTLLRNMLIHTNQDSFVTNGQHTYFLTIKMFI